MSLWQTNWKASGNLSSDKGEGKKAHIQEQQENSEFEKKPRVDCNKWIERKEDEISEDCCN